MSTEAENFLNEVERFLVDHDMPPTVFGQKSLADPNFVFDLREGRDVRFSTVDKIRSFMSSYEKKGRRQLEVVGRHR
jgi:homoserine dehydrogenase